VSFVVTWLAYEAVHRDLHVRAPAGDKVVTAGRFGTTLVATLLAEKYRDGLPLNRQRERFERLGLIAYPASAGSADAVFEAALEAGADDVESSEDGHEIWCSIENLHDVARALEPVLGDSGQAKLAWKPGTMVIVGAEDAAQLMKLIDVLDDDDDVQTVWGNYDVPDDVMAGL
jgi:hypothetical protein